MSIEKIRLFVLGAGFSESAGIPMTKSLLSGALEIMKEECPGIYQRIENRAHTCFENDLPLSGQCLDAAGFSKLSSFLHYIEMRNFGGGERWSDAGDRELLTLKYFISKRISQVTPDTLPELYLKFAEQLDCYDHVMTFNWDCLLEKALQKIGKKYTYNPFEVDWCNPENENTVRVIKMHGSINWTLPHGTQPDPRIYKPIGFDPNFGLEPVFYSEVLMDSDTWQNNDWLMKTNASKFLVQPFIILPGIGKSYEVRKLASFWDRPSGAFYSSRDVYIIGLSLCEDDFFVRFLFLESLPLGDWEEIQRQTVVINPCGADIVNYSFIPNEKKTIRHKPFDINDINYILDQRTR